jgi:hypothetical protein
VRAAGVACAALLSLAAPPASAGVTLEARVVHPDDPSRGARLSLALFGVKRDGETIERAGRTDAEGRLRFADLPAGAAYVLFADYGGIRFSGGTTIVPENEADATRDVVIPIYERSEDPAGLVLRSLDLLVEREAGAWRVGALASVENPRQRAIALPPEAPPALRIGLFAGHSEPRSPFGQLPPGASIEDGALALRGPFLPGTHELRLVYDVASGADALRTSLPVPDPIDALELRVRDFGVAVDAGQLHPARPSRDGDEIYLRYVGFDVEAGSALPLELTALPPRTPLPTPVQAALVALLAGALFLLVARPVGAEREAEARVARAAAGSAEREALFVALRDLEHDFETGKLSAEDRNALRAALRTEALGALSGERAGPAAGELVAAVCACGRAAQPGDRFCAACGKPL